MNVNTFIHIIGYLVIDGTSVVVVPGIGLGLELGLIYLVRGMQYYSYNNERCCIYVFSTHKKQRKQKYYIDDKLCSEKEEHT